VIEIGVIREDLDHRLHGIATVGELVDERVADLVREPFVVLDELGRDVDLTRPGFVELLDAEVHGVSDLTTGHPFEPVEDVKASSAEGFEDLTVLFRLAMIRSYHVLSTTEPVNRFGLEVEVEVRS
jgi:hypothetical protein